MKQREIKFRAMYHDTADNTMKFAYGLVGWMDEKVVQLCVPNGKPIMRADTMNCIPGTLGQFTGLQDKNGKDIYERDAVRYRWRFTEGHRVGEVLFEERGFWAIDDHDKSIAAMLMNPNISDIEVIGNVFEIPELLPTNTTEG